MDIENVIKWLSANGLLHYDILYRGSNTALTKRSAENVDQTIEFFREDYQMLPEGRFDILGKRKATDPTKGVKFPFDKGQLSTSNANNKMSGIDIQELKREAYEQGLKDARYEALVYRIDLMEKEHRREIDELKKHINTIVQYVNDSTDDDKSNDPMGALKPIMEKAAPIIAKKYMTSL